MKPANVLLLTTLTVAGCNRDAPPPVAVSPERQGPPAQAAPAATAASLPPGHPGGQLAASMLPPGHPPTGTAAALAAAAQGPAGMTCTVPKGWEVQTPSSTMRRAQYRVPGTAGPGECVVFYFGPGQGGAAQANAARWASQFRVQGGGDPTSAMKTRQLTTGNVKLMMVEVAGTYAGGMGGTAVELPGYMLLGAIAEGPDANWFFKLTGPQKTVAAQRGAFEAMIRSLRKGAAGGSGTRDKAATP